MDITKRPDNQSRPYIDNRWQAVELTVVVPTFNERDNVSALLRRLEAALDNVGWEVIFVDDDSPDGTSNYLRQIARQNPQVRVIRRIGRRGLASALVEGVLSASTEYFAVMDADMQHDETMLPQMLRRLKEEHLDIVVGSRYAQGGSVEGWNKKRRIASRFAGLAARLVVKADLQDPMSGFFLMRRQSFDETVQNLSQHGFKLLLDLFASAPRPLRFAEQPYEFRRRGQEKSKLDSMVVWEFGMLLADKLFGGVIPPRFLLFAIVGGSGLLAHLITLATALKAGLVFGVSQAIAVLIAMTSNFALNNLITYRDRRLSGWQLVRGLLSFYAVCSIGAVANVGVAAFIYAKQPIWWLAGLAGALIGAVWNYAASALFTWNSRG
jgi:dolichol-phosphate mannosyltransferase